MTIEEIRKNAPQGATHYKIIKDGRPLYFNSNHHYWNWVSLKWVQTIVHYSKEEIKPL
jgi:hypothetical protein